MASKVSKHCMSSLKPYVGRNLRIFYSRIAMCALNLDGFNILYKSVSNSSTLGNKCIFWQKDAFLRESFILVSSALGIEPIVGQ